jgi:E3 ubiquitin-protein ligase MARCH6
VRDVLERSVATQLRKITFSAMVYGALVVICLGGVVWGLAFAFAGVLPIHWSSNEPVLEFPIDLLFYNFFMPLAVKFFKPSDGLHAMYAWWFRKCARILRLTWFLFDERKLDEEGHHVRRSWAEVFKGLKGDATNPIKPGDEHDPFQKDPSLPAYFLRDGRFVRAPASDQVRIPKGGQVFLEIDEDNKRIDGRPESENGVHGRNSEHFKMVYIPPHFRGRIFLFIMSIWLFAAVTGVCITIVPLVFGRHIFAKIIPTHVQKNDVYAFSIGIYILGSALYCIMHIQRGVEWIRRSLAIDAETPTKVLRKTTSMGLRILRVFYAYTALLIVLPSLFALAVEFYFIIPLHTYLAVSEPHVIHFVQSWTLGLLYVKLSTRLILWHADSRPAEALRAVMRDGYFDPDIKIATRAFIFPVTTILVAALLIPATLASAANRYNVFGPGEEQKILAFRYAYPLCLSFLINATGTWMLLGVMKGWRMRIRDEVYLIGERLHNFGDRSKSGTAALIPTGNRLET